MERTMTFFANISLKHTPSHLLSIAILSSTFFAGNAIAADDNSTLLQDISALLGAGESTVSGLLETTCPLNSGGPSLLGTTWRLESIYGNKIPLKLNIDMTVNKYALTGSGGCNEYSAKFKQIGSTDFKVKNISKSKKACVVITPSKAAPTINVGSWEGSYIRTLKRMKSVRQISSSSLQFFNRNGDPAMMFHKITDEKINKVAEIEAETVVAIAKQ
jgi:hypothetical protein